LMMDVPSPASKSELFNDLPLCSEIKEGYCKEDDKIYSIEWKLFEDLEDEEVATLNKETGELEFEEPIIKQVFEHEGDMYNIETEEGNLLVSPEHRVYVKVEYNNKGVGFNVSFIGSTSKPSDSKTITPSKTLSTTSEIQTLKISSLPFNFIHALPLNILITPAPVLTSSSDIDLIPSSSANFLGNTVRLAPVSTNALTFLECFLSKSNTSISANVCPIVDYYDESNYLKLMDYKLVKIKDIYKDLDNKDLYFLDENLNEIKINKIDLSGDMYNIVTS